MGLKLSRFPGESIYIGGSIKITVLPSGKGQSTTFLIDAPQDVTVSRNEHVDKCIEWKQQKTRLLSSCGDYTIVKNNGNKLPLTARFMGENLLHCHTLQEAKRVCQCHLNLQRIDPHG